MAKNDGGHAFPWPGNFGISSPSPGMSVRTWLAGMAMQGLSVGCAGLLGEEFTAYARGPCNAVIAERAYALADAMLAEREK